MIGSKPCTGIIRLAIPDRHTCNKSPVVHRLYSPSRQFRERPTDGRREQREGEGERERESKCLIGSLVSFLIFRERGERLERGGRQRKELVGNQGVGYHQKGFISGMAVKLRKVKASLERKE